MGLQGLKGYLLTTIYILFINHLLHISYLTHIFHCSLCLSSALTHFGYDSPWYRSYKQELWYHESTFRKWLNVQQVKVITIEDDPIRRPPSPEDDTVTVPDSPSEPQPGTSGTQMDTSDSEDEILVVPGNPPRSYRTLGSRYNVKKEGAKVGWIWSQKGVTKKDESDKSVKEKGLHFPD